MKNKYCLPIIKNRKADVLKTIHTNILDYGYFEVWLDYIDDLDNAFIEELIGILKEKLILLFRRQNLKFVQMVFEKRKHIISLIQNSDSLLDLDISAQKEELEYIKNNKIQVKTIVSYHNYNQTPSDEKLKEIIDTIQVYHPEVTKISTFCNSQKDGLQLLKLLLELRQKDLKCIVLGMGGLGTITRIFGTLWGNEMIFAPQVLKEQSAKGQLTKQQLEIIFRELNDV